MLVTVKMVRANYKSVTTGWNHKAYSSLLPSFCHLSLFCTNCRVFSSVSQKCEITLNSLSDALVFGDYLKHFVHGYLCKFQFQVNSSAECCWWLLSVTPKLLRSAIFLGLKMFFLMLWRCHCFKRRGACSGLCLQAGS